MKQQLIILPGWAGTKETWQDFIKIAEKDYKVICFNLPCFGDEPCPKEVWGVENYSEFVKNKIKKLNLEKPILLGHSFGGQVATYLAINNPEIISKLILSGSASLRLQGNSLRKIIFKFIAKFGKIIFKIPMIERFDIFAKKILYYFAGSTDYLKTSGVKREIFKKLITQNLENSLCKISVKTLIIWGTKDIYIPLKIGKKIARLIPNAEFKIIKNGRHGLHIQQPDNLLKIIKEFTN